MFATSSDIHHLLCCDHHMMLCSLDDMVINTSFSEQEIMSPSAIHLVIKNILLSPDDLIYIISLHYAYMTIWQLQALEKNYSN